MSVNRRRIGISFLAFASLALAQPQPPLKALYTFAGAPDAEPTSTVIFDSNGALYGESKYGGASTAGTVFKLTPPATKGAAWTDTQLYAFTGTNGDGAIPMGGVVIGKGNVLYGVTIGGGTQACGTVFGLTPPSSSGWTESVLYSFTCGTDGGQPRAPLVIGNGGVLYGTASSGGTGCGVVFAMRPPASKGAAWTQQVIHTLAGGTGDGCTPFGGLVLGKGEILYGTAETGGTSGNGVVFQLSPPKSPGNPWTESVLYNFAGGTGDGSVPSSTMVLSTAGNLFGTTAGGGSFGLGTAFELTPPGSGGGAWTETLMHSFGAGTDGSFPLGLALGSGTFVYGVTQYTGSSQNCGTGGCGTVFELKPPSSGGLWTEVVLHNFPSQSGDGEFPGGGLAINSKGVLYGTTNLGGTSTACPKGCGILYEVTP